MSSPTVAELLEAWGTPPQTVVEDWAEQLRRLLGQLQREASQRQTPPPSVSGLLSPEAIEVDGQNRITAPHLQALLDARDVPTVARRDSSVVEANAASPDVLIADYREALAHFTRGVTDGHTRPERLNDSRPSLEPVGRLAVPAQGTRQPARVRYRYGLIVAATAVLLVLGLLPLALKQKPSAQNIAPASNARAASGFTNSRPRQTTKDKAKAAFVPAPSREVTLGESPEHELPEPQQGDAERVRTTETLLDQFARFDATGAMSPGLSDNSAAASQSGRETGAGREMSVEAASSGSPPTPAEDGLSLPAAIDADRAAAGSVPGDSAELSEKQNRADAAASMTDSSGAEAIEEIDDTIDPALERPAPVVDASRINAVALPATDQPAPCLLHPRSATDLVLSLSGAPVDGQPRLAEEPSLEVLGDAQTGTWRIIDSRGDRAERRIAQIAVDAQGTHFTWAADVSQAVANELRNGRLRLEFADAPGQAIFLRPVQRAEPIAFDFQGRHLELAWRLHSPPHPLATRLHIDFDLPEEVEHEWIEPPHTQTPRRLVAIGQWRLKDSGPVTLRIRFDVQTGTRLVCRMRYAVKLAPTLAWQWVTTPEALALADRVATGQERLVKQLQQIELLYDRTGRDERAILRSRRSNLERLSEHASTLAERLGQLIELLHRLESGGRIGWRLVARWPDGQQAILAAPLEQHAEAPSAQQPSNEPTRADQPGGVGQPARSGEPVDEPLPEQGEMIDAVGINR